MVALATIFGVPDEYWPWLLPAIGGVLTLLAELWHLRRIRRLRHLAFPDTGRPRRWTVLAPVLRILCVATLAWSCVVLLQIRPTFTEDPEAYKKKGKYHLIIALDVSPSMHLKDAGPSGKQTRRARGRDALQSVFERLDMSQTRVSVVAFYSKAKPVVVDTFDLAVIDNILDDLPLEHAFAAGKTDLYSGIAAAADLAKNWKPNSTTIVVLSDGDTLPARGFPQMPQAIGGCLVVGVGNAFRGQQIDGHSSKQNRQALQHLAARLSGVYHNANERHVPSGVLRQLQESLPSLQTHRLDLRGVALMLSCIAASLLALLTPLLHLAGSRRHPGTVS